MDKKESIPALLAFGFFAASLIMWMMLVALDSTTVQASNPCDRHLENEERHLLCMKRIHAELVARGDR